MPQEVVNVFIDLNLPFTASVNDVVRRYWYRAWREHPDKWSAQTNDHTYAECTERFQQLAAAYECAKTYLSKYPF